MRDFTREDREQFAQLIGYSLSGFSELSYVSDEAYEAAEASYEGRSDPEVATPAAHVLDTTVWGLTEEETVYMGREGWAFVPVGPHQVWIWWTWLKFDKTGDVVARGGDPTWHADLGR